jgi:hypothetical protein
MKKWGIVVTCFYFFVVACLLIPGSLTLLKYRPESLMEWLGIYHDWLVWIWIGILVSGEALLLFLSVDASQKRLKPRQHLLASVAIVALMAALLTFAGFLSFLAAAVGDKLFGEPFGPYLDSRLKLIAWVLGLWGVWGVVFWLGLKSNLPKPAQLAQGLLKGSVLELLIAVPTHAISRHRDDCSAPVATSFGIATGLAIMLLCFGPGVLLLYRKRLAQYPSRKL